MRSLPRRRPKSACSQQIGKKEENVPKRRKRGEFAVVAAFAVLGFLLAVQLKSVKLNTALDATSASRLETLQELYNDLTTERDGLKSRLEEAQKELEQYRDAAVSGEGSAALKAEVEHLSMVAGLTDVEGPGVSVILNDSKAENTTGMRPTISSMTAICSRSSTSCGTPGPRPSPSMESASSPPVRSAVPARWSWSTESALQPPSSSMHRRSHSSTTR